jgi:UDP-glucose 4-epimerase
MHKVALVTGAAGFIGRHVARRLADEGWQVVGIGHGEAPAAEWGLSAWYQDSICEDALNRLDAAPDLVIHCAGSGSVAASIADPESDRKRTVTSTQALLDYLRTHAPNAVFVYPSSAAVYGLCEPCPISESHALRPVSPYGQHKLAAEELIRTYAADHQLRAAIVRLFSVYGPGLRKQLWWDACHRLLNGDRLFFGTGDETRDWLHVEDAAALMVSAAGFASERCPIVNGGSGVATTNRQVLQQLAQTLGEVQHPEFNSQTRPGDPQHYHADIRATMDWGWRPSIDLATGIKQYVDWFREEAR